MASDVEEGEVVVVVNGGKGEKSVEMGLGFIPIGFWRQMEERGRVLYH